MHRTSKRILSLAMALLLVMSLSVPVLAAGKVTPVKGTQTVYLSSKDATSTWAYIQLATGTKNFTIKRADVKVTAGSAGGRMVTFTKNGYKSVLSEEYLSASGKWKTAKSSDTNCEYSAELRFEKTGTSTVSYKIGSKTYKTTIKVLAYKNPIKSITLTGVNGGKSFAAKTKDHMWSEDPLALNKTTKSAKLSIVPAKGWKISNISISDQTTGLSRSVSSVKGLSSAKFAWGTLDASHNYRVYVTFINASNGGMLSTSYQVNGAQVQRTEGPGETDIIR